MTSVSASPIWLRPAPRRAAAAALVWLLAVCGAAWGQDQTVVIGSSRADEVTVDLSVLYDDGASGRGGRSGDLLFPGSRYKPGQRVTLMPPGMVAQRPVLRPPGRTRPPSRALARRPAIPPSRALARRRAPQRTPPPPAATAMPAPSAAAPSMDQALRNPAMVQPAAGPPDRAGSKAPALAAPVIRKRAPAPLARQAAIPPVPAPPEIPPVPSAGPSAKAPPPPPLPRVEAAPRVAVTSKPAARTTNKQVAAIPRAGGVTTGSRQEIRFAPGSSRLEDAGKTALGAVADALAKDPALRVELKAYARGNAETVSQARRLSLSRALAVRSELMRRGVMATRIDVRALGNRVPSGIPNRVDLQVFTR